MSYNRKLLKQMTEESKQKKPQSKPKDRIVDPMGQWKYPGQITRIPFNEITMQGVPYPVLGVGDTGQQQMMFPGQQYSFPGSQYVDEFPLVKAQDGKIILNALKELSNPPKKKQWGDYEIVNSKDANQRYPVYKGDVEQIIATAIGMGYDPKTAMAVALQETGAGKSDPNYFHVLHNDSLPEEYRYMPDDELGIQILKDKKAYANRLGYKTPVMELQAYNGLGKIFPDTERGYHGFRMSKAYGVPIPKEGIDMKKNPLYGKRVLSIKDDVVEYDPFINEKINYWKNFYNNPDSTYYTRGTQLGDIEITAPKKKDIIPDFSNWLHKRQIGGDISVPNLEEGNWLNRYDDGGLTTPETTFPPGYVPGGIYQDRKNAYEKTQQDLAVRDAHQWNQKWMNSPMYKDMLDKSIAASPTHIPGTDVETSLIPDLRKMQAKPSNFEINFKDLKQPNLGGETSYATGTDGKTEIRINTKSEIPISESISHEIIGHGTDASGRLIPKADIDKINRYHQDKKVLNHTDPYQEIATSLNIPYAEAKRKVDYMLKSGNPEFKMMWDELVASQKKVDEEHHDHTKYIGRPTETRSRLMNVRKFASDNKIYDPFTQRMTLENLRKLKASGNHEVISLYENYSEQELLDLFNSISANESSPNLTTAKIGGFIPRYQNAGQFPPRPTTADSLAVYNRALDVQNYYKNRGYTRGPIHAPENTIHDNYRKYISWLKNQTGDVTNTLAVTKKHYLDSIKESRNYYKNKKNRSFPDYKKNLEQSRTNYKQIRKIDPNYGNYLDKDTGRLMKGQGKFPYSEFYQPLNPYQFEQREMSHGFLDLKAPRPLYDTRITPQDYFAYMSPEKDRYNAYGDRVEMYGYDPLAVKPFSMRTPAEKIKWEQLYGVKKPEVTNLKKPLPQEPSQIKMVSNEFTPSLSTNFGAVPTVARQTNIQPNQSGDYVLRFSEWNPETESYTHKERYFKKRKEADQAMHFLLSENDRMYYDGSFGSRNYYTNLSTQGNYQPRVYKRGGQASLNKFYKELFENINKRTGKGNARFLGRALGSLETVIEDPLNALQVLFAKKKRIADVESNPYGIDPFSMQKGHWSKTWFPKYYVDDTFGGSSLSNQEVGNISSNNLIEQSVNQKRSTPHMYGWFDPSIEGGKQGGWHRKLFPTYEDAYNFWKTQHEGKAMGPNVRFDPIREGDDLTEYGDGGFLPRYQGNKGSSQVGKPAFKFTQQQAQDLQKQFEMFHPKHRYGSYWDNKIKEQELQEKAEKERQIQERKNAATTREKVIKGDETAEFTFPNGQTLPWNKMDWRQKAYVTGKNLGSLQRNNLTDFVNPAAIIGSLSEGLATAPYVARETDSYMPYVTGIGAPLLMGRMASTNALNPLGKNFWIGQNTTNQFLNNAFNPLGAIAGALERVIPTRVDDSILQSSIIPTSRRKVKPSVKVTNDKSGQLAGWGDDSYSETRIIPHTTASGNKYNIDFKNIENVPRGYEWQRNFDISNAESQGQHFGFKISKRKNNIPVLEDLSFFNSDPVTANEQLKLFLAGIDNTPIHIPLSERQFGLSSGSQNLSMYSQPIMNVQAARLARQLGSDGKRRLELIYDNTRPLKELNLSYKQGADESSFRDQLIAQWEKINKSYKMLADETGVKMKRPRLYYEKFNSFDMPREVGIEFFQHPRFGGRNALMPVETKLYVPEYGLIKHFGDGGILPRFQGNKISQIPDYLKRTKLPVGDIAQQTGIKSNERILAEHIASQRYKGATISQGTAKKKPEKSRFMQIATNPVTAFGYAARGQKLPENLDAVERNVYDNAIDIINPFAYINEVGQVLGDVNKGEYLSAAVGALGVIPGEGVLARKVGSSIPIKNNRLFDEALDSPRLSKRDFIKNVEGPSGMMHEVGYQNYPTQKGFDFQRTFGMRGKDQTGYLKFDLWKESDNQYPELSDFSYFNPDKVSASDHIKMMMSNLPKKVYMAPAGDERLFSMYSQPIVNANVSRLAANPKRITITPTGKYSILNTGQLEDGTDLNFLQQAAKQFPRLQNSYKTLSEYTRTRLPQPRMYVDNKLVTAEDLLSPELQKRITDSKFNYVSPDVFRIEVPDYSIHKHFKKGGQTNWLDKYK